jgi:Arc/MetJ-type ribon-helix-helix transcriptional regulator
MRIDITGEMEKLIQAQVAAGQFDSPAEFVEATVKHWQRTHNGGPGEAIGPLHEHADIEELAAAQGVGPLRDPAQLRADFWPDDESVDDFVAEIRSLRRQGWPPNVLITRSPH